MSTKAKKLVDIPQDYLILMMEAGYAYLAMRKFQEAFELFEGMAVLAPNSEVPHIALGNVFSAQQKFDDAQKEFKKAIALNEKSPLSWAHMGEVCLLKGEKEKAVEHLNHALALDPKGQAGQFAQALKEALDQGVYPLSEFIAKFKK